MAVLTETLGAWWASMLAYLSFDTALLGEADNLVRLGVQVALLICSAFFSGSETALFSLSRLDLQKLRRDRHRHTETLHELLDQPRRLIISILSGNELVNIAAATNMAGLLVSLYGPERAGVISTFVMVPILLLFGEVTPKTIAISNPTRISADVVAAPMSLWVRFIGPVRWAIRGVADFITSMIVGDEKAAENILQVDEFRSLVEGVAQEGELNSTERALIYNLLEAGDTEIVEIMTPRTRTRFLDVSMSVDEMVDHFRRFQHPRVPVYRAHRDNLVGFLHAEDVLRLVMEKRDLSALRPEDIMRPAVVAPLTKKVDEMFDFFQHRNARAAAVLNEFGGVEGFITMKDVLMFIFGQVAEKAGGQEHYQERDDNVYEVPGDMKLTDFNNLTNFGIEDPRMTTIGGVAFRHLDRLPGEGDQVVVEGIVITVLEMEAHRIVSLRVSRGLALDGEAEETDTTEKAAETEETTKKKKKKKKKKAKDTGMRPSDNKEPENALEENESAESEEVEAIREQVLTPGDPADPAAANAKESMNRPKEDEPAVDDEIKAITEQVIDPTGAEHTGTTDSQHLDHASKKDESAKNDDIEIIKEQVVDPTEVESTKVADDEQPIKARKDGEPANSDEIHAIEEQVFTPIKAAGTAAANDKKTVATLNKGESVENKEIKAVAEQVVAPSEAAPQDEANTTARNTSPTSLGKAIDTEAEEIKTTASAHTSDTSAGGRN